MVTVKDRSNHPVLEVETVFCTLGSAIFSPLSAPRGWSLNQVVNLVVVVLIIARSPGKSPSCPQNPFLGVMPGLAWGQGCVDAFSVIFWLFKPTARSNMNLRLKGGENFIFSQNWYIARFSKYPQGRSLDWRVCG